MIARARDALRGVLATETAVLRSPLPKDEVEQRLNDELVKRGWRISEVSL